MSNEIAVRQHATLTEKMAYSKALATSNLLPKAYRDNPGNLLFAVEYAEALNVSPIHALTSIHVIDGKPSASADLIAGLVRRAGHKLRIIEEPGKCTAQIIRADDPDFTFTAMWDMAKATLAGVLNNPTWKKYPSAMLRSRAITEVARQAASDALYGIIYSAEELGANVDDLGEVVEDRPVHGGTVAAPPAPQQSRTRSGVAALREATTTPPAAPVPSADDMIAQAIGSESREELRAMWHAAEGHPEAGRIREMVQARVAELPIDAEIVDEAVA